MCFQVTVVEEMQERRPAIAGVLNGISECGGGGLELLLVKPALEVFYERLCQLLPESDSLFIGEPVSQLFDLEDAFDDANGIISQFLFGYFGVLEVSVHVSPAIGRDGAVALLIRSASAKHAVVHVCAVSEEESLKAGKEAGMVVSFAILGKVVEVVGSGFIASVQGDFALDRFSSTFTDEGHAGFIRLDDQALPDELMHTVVEDAQFVSCALEPAAHGRAVDGNTVGQKYLFLAVQGQVIFEFGLGDVCDNRCVGVAFFNGLRGLGGTDQILVAHGTGVGVLNVFDSLISSGNVGELGRDGSSSGGTGDIAARAQELSGIGYPVVLRSFVLDAGRRVSAAATVLWRRWLSELFSFAFDLLDCFFVHCFTFAFDVIYVDACRFGTVDVTVVPANLFFQLENAVPKPDKELVALGERIRKRIRQSNRTRSGGGFCHVFSLALITIFYSIYTASGITIRGNVRQLIGWRGMRVAYIVDYVLSAIVVSWAFRDERFR